MKTRLTIAIILVAILSAQAQTADEIVSKYLAKTGGIDKWKAVKTRKVIAKISMQGVDLPVTMFEKPRVMKRMEIHAPGLEIIQVYDGKEGWMLNPAMGKDPIKLTDEQTKDYANDDFEDDFIDYKKKGYEVTYVGVEDVDGIKCFKLQLIKNKNEDGKEIHFFDAETYFRVLEVDNKKDESQAVHEIKSYSSDYHEVNGLMFPFYQESKSEGQTLDKMTIEKIILDEPMEDSFFTLAKK